MTTNSKEGVSMTTKTGKATEVSRPKHTEGPWEAKPHPELLDGVVEVFAGNLVVARAYGWCGVIGNIPANSELWRQKKLDRKSEAEANAHLIASAPDMKRCIEQLLANCMPNEGKDAVIDYAIEVLKRAEGRA